MKKLRCLVLIGIAFLFSVSCGHARFVTLIVSGEPGQPRTAEANIAQGEVAELVSFPANANANHTLTVQKPGAVLRVKNYQIEDTWKDHLIIAGPATITLEWSSQTGNDGFCTWKIEPESFPPDKTLVIPQGTGARIALECSTNLLEWSELYANSYTNVPSNKFFRIKAERIP